MPMPLVKGLVSVIMPVYDANPFHLEKSVSSILNQTYNELEFIVIMDKTATPLDSRLIEVLNAFKDDHRLKIVIHDVRKGLVESLNEGILLSKGEYLARADSDDISFKDRLNTQLNFLTCDRKDLVGSWAYVIDDSERIRGKLILPVTSESIRKSIMMHNVILHGSVLMRKEVLKKTGLYNPVFFGSEDYELWLRLISKGYLLANCPKFLLFLRENPSSVTRGKAWFKTRVGYTKSKGYACLKYGYLNWKDIFSFFASFISFAIHPSMSIPLKNIVFEWQIKVFA
jgi:cellulose synthase/poly-beta-1,6-N-acetylglucosamine synthase-like glycosyltransferase